MPRATDGETVKVDQLRLNTRTVHRKASNILEMNIADHKPG